jgi:hypothetical protein
MWRRNGSTRWPKRGGAPFSLRSRFRPRAWFVAVSAGVEVLGAKEAILVGVVERAIGLVIRCVLNAFDDQMTSFIRRHICGKSCLYAERSSTSKNPTLNQAPTQVPTNRDGRVLLGFCWGRGRGVEFFLGGRWLCGLGLFLCGSSGGDVAIFGGRGGLV